MVNTVQELRARLALQDDLKKQGCLPTQEPTWKIQTSMKNLYKNASKLRATGIELQSKLLKISAAARSVLPASAISDDQLATALHENVGRLHAELDANKQIVANYEASKQSVRGESQAQAHVAAESNGFKQSLPIRLQTELADTKAMNEESIRRQATAAQKYPDLKEAYKKKLAERQLKNAALDERLRRETEDLRRRLDEATTEKFKADSSCDEISQILKSKLLEVVALETEKETLRSSLQTLQQEATKAKDAAERTEVLEVEKAKADRYLLVIDLNFGMEEKIRECARRLAELSKVLGFEAGLRMPEPVRQLGGQRHVAVSN